MAEIGLKPSTLTMGAAKVKERGWFDMDLVS